jgi:hypothetical protein
MMIKDIDVYFMKRKSPSLGMFSIFPMLVRLCFIASYNTLMYVNVCDPHIIFLYLKKDHDVCGSHILLISTANVLIVCCSYPPNCYCGIVAVEKAANHPENLSKVWNMVMIFYCAENWLGKSDLRRVLLDKNSDRDSH